MSITRCFIASKFDVRRLAFLLENGAMYHVAHSVALVEYLLTLYFKPEYKQWPYVSLAGEFHLP